MRIRLLRQQGMNPAGAILDVPESSALLFLERGVAEVVGPMPNKAQKLVAVKDKPAPYGLRKDGTPRAKPGPKPERKVKHGDD